MTEAEVEGILARYHESVFARYHKRKSPPEEEGIVVASVTKPTPRLCKFFQKVSAQMLVSSAHEPCLEPLNNDLGSGFLLGSHLGEQGAKRLYCLLSREFKFIFCHDCSPEIGASPLRDPPPIPELLGDCLFEAGCDGRNFGRGGFGRGGFGLSRLIGGLLSGLENTDAPFRNRIRVQELPTTHISRAEELVNGSLNRTIATASLDDEAGGETRTLQLAANVGHLEPAFRGNLSDDRGLAKLASVLGAGGAEAAIPRTNNGFPANGALALSDPDFRLAGGSGGSGGSGRGVSLGNNGGLEILRHG